MDAISFTEKSDEFSVASVSSCAQITIPKNVRTVLGIKDKCKIAFVTDGDTVIMTVNDIPAMVAAQEKLQKIRAVR